MNVIWKKRKWISWLLIFTMLIPMLSGTISANAEDVITDGAIIANAEESITEGTITANEEDILQVPYIGPTVSADGNVTFRYQGDVNVEDGQFVVLRGQFNNWENVKLEKGEGNIWTKTIPVSYGGAYEYGMAIVKDITDNSNGWVGDPSNPVAGGGNSKIVRNPVEDSITGTTKIYYYPETTSDIANVYYRLSETEDAYKSIPMTKDEKYTAIYSALIGDAPGNYEYYIEVNGVNIGDPNTDNPTFTLVEINNELVADTFVNQPGGETVWRVTGSLGDLDNWNPGNENTIMKHLVGEYYAFSTVLLAGNYEFKFTKNGGWDHSVGRKSDGNNFSLTLTEPAKVNFYINDDMDGVDFYDKFRTNQPALEEQGIKQYIPDLSSDKWPRLVGNIQEVIGDGVGVSWSPENAKTMFIDYYFNNTVYKLQRNIVKGNYECKIVFGNNWSGLNYGAGNNNLAINIIDNAADVVFTTDTTVADKELTHNYIPQESTYDGLIDVSALYFNSREITYKKPFGAIKQGQSDVTFRFNTKASDASLVKLELIDGAGLSKAYNMEVTTVLDDKDYWEVTIPAMEFNSIGVWGYKFIVIDGATKIEYGDDSVSGGTGAYSSDGQTPYDLTVYLPDYKTPDWMKDAIVYQIFPDRFFDGDTSNNRAKVVDGYRGYTKEDGSIGYYPLQYFDGLEDSEGVWTDYPENPRQSEEANKPYYPDATTDGQWTNEFYGGDLAGIKEKLSYLKTLGVTVIYLNPVSWAASNHKYDATDYMNLDPMFGKAVYNKEGDPSSGLNYEATKIESDKVYQAFADACNAVGIKLISDGVFNHVGDDSIYFDRYEKYSEIGAYEYWSRVWDEVEKTIPLAFNEETSEYDTQVEYNVALQSAKSTSEQKVKDYFKSLLNSQTGTNYTDDDFNYITWFEVGPEKVYDTAGKFVRYEYDSWWGFDSLPAVASVTADITNLTNDENATIAGSHEYNNVDYREQVIGYDLTGKTEEEASKAMQEANSQRWLWMGSSGWRLDVAPDVTDDTWKQFRTSVKSAEGRVDANGNSIANPIILGEEWNVATHYLLGDMFDSVMNYQFRAALQNFIVNSGDAKAFDSGLEAIRENYPKEAWYAMLNLVDSHDTVRNITKIDNPTWEEENTKNAPEASDKAIKLQELTAIFQMSYPGAPTIYYGDEVGVTGTKDPDSRRTFPWERVSENADGTYSSTGRYADLFDTYVKAAEVRTTYKDVFATGDIKTAYAEGTVIAYARKSVDKGGLSVINRGDALVKIEADVVDFLPDGLILKDQLGNGSEVTVVDGKVVIEIPAYTGMMMVSTNELGAVPTAPSNLVAVGNEGVTPSVTLSWDLVEEATGYKVYRSLLDGTVKTLLTETPIIDTTFIDTNVVNGTRYYYYVKAVALDSISSFSESATALPSYKIESISVPSLLPPVTIGVGIKTENTVVTINIPGLTDNTLYAGKEVPNLKFSILYYVDNEEAAGEVKLRYEEDVKIQGEAGETIVGKIYSASFEPTMAGTYKYLAKASINNGFTYTKSEIAEVLAMPSDSDTTPPAIPVLAQSTVESNRVTLNWSSSNEDVVGYEIYRVESGGVEKKLDTLASTARSYIDYTVSNDTNYIYRVAAYDSSYNRSYSESMSIIPQLTMVDVTLRLTIPEKVFTSATDGIYIAGDVNGWNASGWLMKKPSGATNNNIVEYTFKMLSGKSMQYKYTRGSWATEALTSAIPNDLTSPGNYGYSSTDTNITVKIVNQGGNKMLIEDTVLRWVDMPMMITVPRISYHGETIGYTTTDSSYNLQASVPFGGIFTINGVDINTISPGALDQYGNVRLDNIPLEEGLNNFVLHIEPTEETKSMPWLTDTGRINSQMTATTTIQITREVGTPTDIPTVIPTEKPTEVPTKIPTQVPTQTPTKAPTQTPTVAPTTTPTIVPIVTPKPTGTPSPTVKPTATPIPTKEPAITGKGGATGWSAIGKVVDNKIKELSKVNKGDKDTKSIDIKVDMRSNSIVPTCLLYKLMDNNINLILDMGDYLITINGKSINHLDLSLKGYNLKVTELNSTSKVNMNKTLNKLIKEKKLDKLTKIKQFELAHKGKLPFSATLLVKVGSKYKNEYVFLSSFNEKTNSFEVTSFGKVNAKGNVKLELQSGTQYVITLQNFMEPTVITSKTIYTNQIYLLNVNNRLDGYKVTYSTSNKSIATISKTGKITGKAQGKVTITTKIVGAGKTYTFKTVVTVKNSK